MIDYPDVDMNRLEWEWARLPDECEAAANKVAGFKKQGKDQESKIELLKDEMKLLAAEIKHDIRMRPEHYHLTRINEDSIAEMSIMQKEYKEAQQVMREAQQELNQLKHKEDLARSVYEKWLNKKSSLENIVKLWLGSYFSTPYCDQKEYMKKSSQEKMDADFGHKRKSMKDDDNQTLRKRKKNDVEN